MPHVGDRCVAGILRRRCGRNSDKGRIAVLEYASIETKSAPTHFRQKSSMASMKRPVPASRISATIPSTSTSTFTARSAAIRTDGIDNLPCLAAPPPQV
jgi:hypothetical protein